MEDAPDGGVAGGHVARGVIHLGGEIHILVDHALVKRDGLGDGVRHAQQHPAPIGSLVCSLREATQVLIDHLVVHESEWGERERERESVSEESQHNRKEQERAVDLLLEADGVVCQLGHVARGGVHLGGDIEMGVEADRGG